MLALRTSINSVMEQNNFQIQVGLAQLSPDGQRLVTYSDSEGKSRLYNLSGTEIAQYEGSFRGFGEDSQRLVTYSYSDRKSRLYNLFGTQIAQYDGNFREFSEDGQRLVTTLRDQDISRVYSVSGILLAEFSGSVFDVSNTRRFLPDSLGFTPDGQHLLTRSSDGYIHLWRLDNGLDDLLERGCTLAQEYLRNHPEETRAQFCLSNYKDS
jgi:WD40 repeat protein